MAWGCFLMDDQQRATIKGSGPQHRKVSLLRPNGFYGWVQTYSIPGMWEPGGGTIDIKKGCATIII